MADIITPILSVVSLLCSCNGNIRYYYLGDFHENKDALNTAMEKLKDTRDDVKRRVDEAENHPYEPRRRTREVDGWLKHVQTIEGEVGEILQKADQEIEGRWLGAYCPKNCWSSRKIGKLLIRKLPIVNDLRSKGSFVDVAYKLRPPSVQEEPTSPTVGMESTFKKVLKLIADDEVRVMGLYGQGGVGKTTLLKQINNEFLKSTTNITHGFDVVILVVVSKEINIDKIQEEIANRLGLSWPNINHFNIRSALTKMNFLLLVDDIWERVDLQRIGVPRSENNKSKVIFTTRSKTICGAMDADKNIRMKCLPWNEAWTLFQEKVGGNKSLNSHPEVPKLAEAVARECGGLPLALITIGRAMSTKKTVREWNHAITTLQEYAAEFPGMGDEILPLLKLSYDSLRTDMIKSCFLYCALFPDDHFIDIAKLIDYWIGEGFILLNEFEHIEKARNKGYDVIGILKDACLLESGGDKETEVKMHDTVRDLALWIVCECGSSKRDKMLIIGESNSRSERLWYNAERVLLRRLGGRGEANVYLPPPKSPNLLTLIYDLPSVRFTLPYNFFQFMPLLRVLDLSHSHIKTFPLSITELLELQHLSLSWTYIDLIPGELKKLVKLKYLDLSHMHNLMEIPNGVISSLFKLRVLYLQGSSVGDWGNYPVRKSSDMNMDMGMGMGMGMGMNMDMNINMDINMDMDMDMEEVYGGVGNLPRVASDIEEVYGGVGDLPRVASDIEEVDGGVGNLPRVAWDIEEVYKLKHLNDLRITINTQATLNKLLSFSYRNLRMCTTHLHLHVYYTDFSSSTTSLSSSTWVLGEDNIKSLGKLELLSNLETLLIQSLPLNMEWENHLKAQQQLGSFQNLSQITILQCHVLKDLTWVVYLENLKCLDVESCEEIEEIIVGDKISTTMMNIDIFKSLKRLKVTYLPKLKSICSHALVFPSLVSMYVFKCPELKKLPFDSRSNVNNTLQVIEGQQKWWSELEWEDHDNVKSKFLSYIEHRHFKD